MQGFLGWADFVRGKGLAMNKLRSTGLLLSLVVLLGSIAVAQHECDVIPAQVLNVARDSTGVLHQIECWNAATAQVVFPSLSPTAGVTSFNTRTGAVVPALNDYSFSLLSGAWSLTQVYAGGSASLFLNGAGGYTTPAGAVGSVFGRTGAVVAAANDYNFNQLVGSWSASQVFAGGSASTFLNGAGGYTTPAGAVGSVFGRTGAVVAASADYTCSQVTGCAPSTSVPTLVTVTFSAAQILTINNTTTQLTLVAAPGAGLVIAPVQIVCNLQFASTPYAATGDQISAGFNPTGSAYLLGATIPVLLNSASSEIGISSAFSLGNTLNLVSNQANLPLVLGNNSVTSPTLGNSPLVCTVRYFVQSAS
jgi:hypothetical protein